MSKRRKSLKALGLVLGLASLLVFAFHQTLFGLLKQRLPWKEDACIGKPLSELERTLVAQGQSLAPLDASSFYSLTDKRLKQNQRAMRFTKGKEYSWFHFGTAVNVGYVVVEKADRELISEILHGRSVDSL
jgi:hypothetical protein